MISELDCSPGMASTRSLGWHQEKKSDLLKVSKEVIVKESGMELNVKSHYIQVEQAGRPGLPHLLAPASGDQTEPRRARIRPVAIPILRSMAQASTCPTHFTSWGS